MGSTQHCFAAFHTPSSLEQSTGTPNDSHVLVPGFFLPGPAEIGVPGIDVPGVDGGCTDTSHTCPPGT